LIHCCRGNCPTRATYACICHLFVMKHDHRSVNHRFSGTIADHMFEHAHMIGDRVHTYMFDIFWTHKAVAVHDTSGCFCKLWACSTTGDFQITAVALICCFGEKYIISVICYSLLFKGPLRIAYYNGIPGQWSRRVLGIWRWSCCACHLWATRLPKCSGSLRRLLQHAARCRLTSRLLDCRPLHIASGTCTEGWRSSRGEVCCPIPASLTSRTHRTGVER
jgi:hypothetical protein